VRGIEKAEVFHSSFVALLVRESYRHNFRALSVTPEMNRVPHLTKDSTVVGLVRVIGKPVDFANAPDWLVDHLSDDDFVALRADGIELVAPIVTSAIDRREAILVFGEKRAEEPYSREARELVAAVADSLAMLVQPRSGKVDAEEALAECPRRVRLDKRDPMRRGRVAAGSCVPATRARRTLHDSTSTWAWRNGRCLPSQRRRPRAVGRR
jgi:hypothetical protein